MEAYPVPPNGKFYPYKHQTKIIGTILENPQSAIIADCGLGKTGSAARAMEIVLERGEVQRGKILISSPLSILNVSWQDDIRKFTNLNPCVLWTNESAKEIYLSEESVLADFGSPPPNTIAKKSKDGVWYRNIYSGAMKRRLDDLDSEKDWERHVCKWKQAQTLDGQDVPFGEIRGRRAEKEKTRELLLRRNLFEESSKYDLYLINHDSVRNYEDLLKEVGFEWVLVDESTKIKSPTSSLSRSHTAISYQSKRRNVMTGTPNPNGFQDLWQQYYFVDRGLTLEPSYKDYLYSHFTAETVGYRKDPASGQDIKKVRYRIRSDEERQTIATRVRRCGVFLKQRDCIDLPPRIDVTRISYMTEEQEKAYDSMCKNLVAEVVDPKTGDIVIAEASIILTKIMKLRQITSGFLVGNDGSMARMDNNPKLKELDDFLEEIGDQKCVIAAQFREELDILLERYKEFNPRVLRGGLSLEQRDKAVSDFQNDESVRLIFLQPKAAAHGITLTAASCLIYLSLDYDFDAYYQVAKRIERIGQKSSMTVAHSIARFRDGTETIDESLMEVLHYKNQDREALFSGSAMNDIDIARLLISKIRDREKED